MKTKNSLYILIILFSIVLNSCKKYEEGPGFSLRFRETRVEGFWLFEKFEYDGMNVIDSGWVNEDSSYVYFSKGGEYEVVNELPDNFGKEAGVWHMGRKKSGDFKRNEYLEVDKFNRVVNYRVIKMTNNSLKYDYHDTVKGEPHFVVIHLKPKIL